MTLTAQGAANFTTFLADSGLVGSTYSISLIQLPISTSSATRNTPFLTYDSTLLVTDYTSFQNNGAGVTWIPFDVPGLRLSSLCCRD